MIADALTTVFRKWQYLLLSGMVAVVVFAFATWIPNLQLLASVLANPLVPIADKIALPIHLMGSITTNFTTLAATYTIAIALLVGVNVALVAYQIRRQRRFSGSGAGASSVGILSGILGVGCAACNSLVLMSVLGVAGGAGIIPFLPLKGGEFGILGVLLLGVATYLMAKQIEKPLVCEP